MQLRLGPTAAACQPYRWQLGRPPRLHGRTESGSPRRRASKDSPAERGVAAARQYCNWQYVEPPT
eukprot:2003961-Alexandrium_andersonii.AAC.1